MRQNNIKSIKKKRKKKMKRKKRKKTIWQILKKKLLEKEK